MAVLAARRKEVLDEIAAQINGKGQTAFVVVADVTKEADVARLFAETKRAFGRVDIVINNAGVPSATPVDEMTLPYWNEVLAVNLTGPFLVSREAVKTMKAQTPQGGRIINIGSISQKTPRPDSMAYTATKHALQGMTTSSPWIGASTAWCRRSFTRRHIEQFLGAARAHQGWAGQDADDYIMAGEDVARVAVLMCALSRLRSTFTRRLFCPTTCARSSVAASYPLHQRLLASPPASQVRS